MPAALVEWAGRGGSLITGQSGILQSYSTPAKAKDAHFQDLVRGNLGHRDHPRASVGDRLEERR